LQKQQGKGDNRKQKGPYLEKNPQGGNLEVPKDDINDLERPPAPKGQEESPGSGMQEQSALKGG